METTELWSRVRDANRAWTGDRPEDVSDLFHPDAVVVSRDGRVVVRGRDAIVASFVEYCEQARTHSFEELDHDVRIFGDTAVLTYGFAVSYEIEGARYDERGREILVFAREGGRWAVVWRMQVPGPTG